MAVSGSYDYTESVTAANIIALALRRCGVYDPEETINSTEESNALVTLNLILKEWSKDIAFVAYKTVYLFPTPDNQVYSTSSSSNYFATATTATQLASAAASGASTVAVDSDDNISDTDLLIVELDDGTLDPQVVNGSPSGDVVTLTSTLSGAAAVDNYVYNFAASTRWQEPFIEIVSANKILQTGTNLAQAEAGQMIPLDIVGRKEYDLLSKKLQTGPATLLYHERAYNDSKFYLWPVRDTSDYHKLEITGVVPLQDLDGTTDNFQLPPEGFNALGWQLAWEMAPEYGLARYDRDHLGTMAAIKSKDFFDSQYGKASTILTYDSTRR